MDVFKLTCVIVSVFMWDQVGSVLSDRQGAATKPSVTILGETKDSSQLQCTFQSASPKPVVQWKNGAGDIVPAEEPQVSQRGDLYDVVLQTTVNKTGLYHCVATQEEIHLKIFVTVPGAAPPPSVKILNATGDGVLLQCSVRGASPKPQVEWQTSDGKNVPAEEPQVSQRGDLYDVLLATVNKMKTVFRCVVKQDGFGHVIDDELFVPDILLEDKSCYSTSVVPVLITIIITLLVVICVETLIIIRNRRKATGARAEETIELNGTVEQV